MPPSTPDKIVPLTGTELKAKLNECKTLSKKDTAKACGYYSVGHDGSIKVYLQKFYDAVLASEGINISPTMSHDHRGRQASYKITVNQNGQALIGAIYLKEIGLSPGDQLEIKISKQENCLIPISADHVENP